MAYITSRKHFGACKIATTYGETSSLEGGVVLYLPVFYYELQWLPFFCHSVSGWGLKRLWRCGLGPSRLPGYLSPVAMRAPVGSEYPSVPLHGATCWLGVLLMFLLNFVGDISACNVRKTNNRKEGASVPVHTFMGGYICWYFLYSSPRVDLGFHNTRGVLYPNTQRNGLGDGRGIFW